MRFDTYYCTKCGESLDRKDCEWTGQIIAENVVSKKCKAKVRYCGIPLIIIGMLILSFSALILHQDALAYGTIISGAFFALGIMRIIDQNRIKAKILT